MIRLFVNGPLAAGQTFEASPEQARYLTGVMRQAPGDRVLVFNGRDGEWLASLSDVTRRNCKLTPEAQTHPQSPGPDIELVMALVKRSPLELVVEKATELGVRRIRLVTTRRTNADHTNVSRLNIIATEAAEQCERLDVPTVETPVRLDHLLDHWPDDRRLIFCDEADAQDQIPGATELSRARPLLEVIESGSGVRWSILIGPEGGFDPAERARMLQHPSVTSVTLGPRILRAETAAISALVLWQATLGDWRRP